MEANYFDPGRLADDLRLRLIKEGRYLVARIAGAGQDPGERKVLGDYFRYKDYIHNREWLADTPAGRWRARYLGFKENWRDLPVEEINKIEFQNPPYSAAHNLSGDPKDYRKVFTVQVAGCDFDCNYCFVPKSINVGDPKSGRFFSAGEIVDNFLSVKNNSSEPINVLRVSGGNPTIVPEMIVDVYRELEIKSPSTYLWIDSNLSAARHMAALGKEFTRILKQKNVGVVGCFKGFLGMILP